MPIEDIQVGVSGGTPGNDSSEYVLFDSTKHLSGAGPLPSLGIDRAQFSVDNHAAGTLNSYWSPDHGTTWNLNSQAAVAANGGGATSGILASQFDFSLTGFPDWKLTWTNGGVAQSPWQPTLTLSRGQKQASV